MRTRDLVEQALALVRQNITEHVFLEIQRNTDLFRSYVNLVSGDDETQYGEINRQIGLEVEFITGGTAASRTESQISTLVQTFTCFNPESVHIG